MREVERVAALAAQRSARYPGGPFLQTDQASDAGVEVGLHLSSGHGDQDAYSLRLDAAGGEIVASSPCGLFRGLTTLSQWVALHREGAVPGIAVEDAPDLRHRGFLLDISRDRVPTMETLFALIEHMADWKLNQLQLYTEHTFAYAGHQVVWRGASPLTPDEIDTLDAFCRERFIELVPNQQSFGHMHRWLVHERYRPLAEVPEGIEHPFSDKREPFGLCPTDPGSLDLLADLYAQLLPHFSSRSFNVGLDETLDLGRGRSAQACRERGRRAVYLDFLNAVRDLAARHDRRIQFWADVLLADGEAAPVVPSDATPLVWGYEADHPFARDLSRLADRASHVYVCPGTSSWMSLSGRLTNALGNLAAAARAARTAGAAGMLVTDWGDHGHLQPLPVSYPALLAGAGFAWRGERTDLTTHQLGALLDVHAFPALPGGGAALCALGDVYSATGVELKNSSVLFPLLVFPDRDLEHVTYQHLTPDGLERAEWAAKAVVPTSGDPSDPSGAQLEREIEWVAALLQVACRLGRARLEVGRAVPVQDLPAAVRRRLLDAYAPLVATHGPLWLSRSRPGGRQDSVARLERLLDRLRD